MYLFLNLPVMRFDRNSDRFFLGEMLQLNFSLKYSCYDSFSRTVPFFHRTTKCRSPLNNLGLRVRYRCIVCIYYQKIYVFGPVVWILKLLFRFQPGVIDIKIYEKYTETTYHLSQWERKIKEDERRPHKLFTGSVLLSREGVDSTKIPL